MDALYQNPPRNGEGDRSPKAKGGGAEYAADPLTPPPAAPVPLPVPGRNERGFTLVELMIVIVIIGLLAAIVIINVRPALDRGVMTKTKADISNLETAMEMYRLDNLRYPTTEEGLQALIAGRYIRRLENDPWGNPYRYAVPGQNGEPYSVMSLGADGREGGSGENADIAN